MYGVGRSNGVIVKKAHPSELAVDLLSRSVCAVQVAAVLQDSWGILSWGWNSMGPDGLGLHAERHCLLRANRKRVRYAILWVAARRKRNGKTVTARPCGDCQRMIAGMGVGIVFYRDGEGKWRRMVV